MRDTVIVSLAGASAILGCFLLLAVLATGGGIAGVLLAAALIFASVQVSLSGRSAERRAIRVRHDR
jgi:hypothetical protein